MIDNIIKSLKKTMRSLGGESNDNTCYQYKSLTPYDDADKDGEYSKALYQALKNDSVKNIAVTGPYGSGKSSVLKTFEKKYSNKVGFEFLNITLGSFNVESKESQSKKADDGKTNHYSDDQNTFIEKSLLQQIIFKVEGDNLPDSHFSRVVVTNWASKLGISLLLVLWAASIYYYVNPNFSFFSNLIFFETPYLPLVKIFTICASIFITQLLLKLLSKPTLSKLGVATAEITFNERRGDSVLNKHLDEIIYFFSKTKFNVVIFEDLDRFEDKEIFAKLREINVLLNNSDQIRSLKKSIKFIYALGDDVFKNTDRTKLFDFIVPIIPVVNSTNAAEMLKNEIKLAFQNHTINNNFFNDVTLYIDEMRLLLNITNEFVIYKNKLSAVSKIDLRDDKLLSLIIYKNKYPKDFASLNNGKSLINKIFNEKSKFHSELMKKVKTKIDELQKHLEKMNDESCKSLNELRAIYVSKLFELNPNKSYFNVNGQTYDSLLREDVFNALRKQNSEIREQHYNTLLAKSFSDLENKVDPHSSFSERELLILNRKDEKSFLISKEIYNLESEAKEIKNKNIKQLIEDFPEYDPFDVIKKPSDEDFGLLKFLVSNGYIDEDYESYTSFFYEGDLTSHDKQFLISVTSHEPLDFEFKLTNLEQIYNRLANDISRFSANAILNLDLYNHLCALENKDDLIATAFRTVEKNAYGAQFCFQYLSTKSNKRVFLNYLSSTVADSFWKSTIQKISIKDKNDLSSFLRNILEHIDIDDLLKINKNGFFTDYFSKEPEVIRLLGTIDSEKSRKIINTLKLKFSDIKNCDELILRDYIYQNQAYEINIKNIETLLEGETASSETSCNYSKIIDSSKTELINYVHENVNEFISNVLSDKNAKIMDSGVSITKLLNNSSVSVENATLVIENVNFKLEKLSSIPNQDLWDSIVEQSKLLPTWNNVLTYFGAKNDSLNESLILFLNQEVNHKSLSLERMYSKHPKANILSKKIVYETSFTDDAFKDIAKSVPFWYEDLSEIPHSAEKVNVMLHSNLFKLTPKNFEFLKGKFSSLSHELIKINLDKFIENSSEYNLELNDYKNLLESKELSKSSKVKLLKSITANKFAGNDSLGKLVSGFLIKNKISQIYSNEIIETILKCELDINQKLAIFNQYSSRFKLKEVIGLISAIGKPISGLRQNKRPKITLNKEAIEFVRVLENNNLISHTIEGSDIRLNPKAEVLE